MFDWPSPGTRVAIRSHRPSGAQPRFTDTIGELLSGGAVVRVRHKSGSVVEISLSDIVSVRTLPPIPVLNRDIRSMQRAAAFGWPGTEHAWVDGWFVRAAHGHSLRGNSAVPLEHCASLHSLDGVARWYRERQLPAVICLPDRLIHPADDLPTTGETAVLVRDLAEPDGNVDLPSALSRDWLVLHGDTHPNVAAALGSAVDGVIAFASVVEDGHAVAIARGAVTEGWLGISAVRVAESHRRRGLARQVCGELLRWGAAHGARRAYVQVRAENTAGLALYPTLGFTEQHRYRYATIRAVGAEK